MAERSVGGRRGIDTVSPFHSILDCDISVMVHTNGKFGLLFSSEDHNVATYALYATESTFPSLIPKSIHFFHRDLSQPDSRTCSSSSRRKRAAMIPCLPKYPTTWP